MLKGTGVSEGYGIGNAVIIEDVSLDYSGVRFTDPDTEKARLTAAIEEVIRKTEQIAEELKESAGEKEAEIMLGHIGLINDPFMKSQMEEKIDAGSVAEAAADETCQFFEMMFANSGDTLMEQRASDIADIKTDLLSTLLGVQSVDISAVPKGSILIAKDFTPSMTGRIKKENVEGIVAEVGGVTSHSAILARAMGIPAVLSVADAVSGAIADGQPMILDGSAGKLILDPSEEEKAAYEEKKAVYLSELEELKKFASVPTVTKNGVARGVYGNIGKPEDAQMVVQNGGEGIGLFRTEFLFMDRDQEPTEEEQFEAYSTVAKTMRDREVIIRTLDIGGDKEIPFLPLQKEDNPFMGYRAIRFCLDNKDLYKRQIRAILRASEFGNVKIMLPLVTCMEEVTEAKAFIAECAEELRAEGKDIKDVPVGIMVETPSAAIISDQLAEEVAFFSIGTNDLTGYTMCADRGNQKVAHLYDCMYPSVLRAIEMTIKNAKAAGIPVGMCGEAAADPRLIPKLLEWGLDEFSVTPSSILKTRKIISEHDA